MSDITDGTEMTERAKIKPRTKDLSRKEEMALRTYHAMTEQAQRLIILEAYEGSAHKAARSSQRPGVRRFPRRWR